MHFWGNYSIFNRLALEKCAKDYEDRIVRIEKPGQVFLLDEITAVPGFWAVTFPFLVTVAIVFLLLDHFTFFFVPFTFKV